MVMIKVGAGPSRSIVFLATVTQGRWFGPCGCPRYVWWDLNATWKCRIVEVGKG
jgi:hypothetical protein